MECWGGGGGWGEVYKSLTRQRHAMPGTVCRLQYIIGSIFFETQMLNLFCADLLRPDQAPRVFAGPEVGALMWCTFPHTSGVPFPYPCVVYLSRAHVVYLSRTHVVYFSHFPWCTFFVPMWFILSVPIGVPSPNPCGAPVPYTSGAPLMHQSGAPIPYPVVYLYRI